tara:strand:- start:9160 stop:9753 length:594 start_codon:yes stop_codon:yes gene_type:complete
MKKQIKIHSIKGNPNNPRIIKNDKFTKLVHSIQTLPGYMELRPIIIDEDNMVLGGNMRLKASMHLGNKMVWTDMFTKAMSDEMNVKALEDERKPKTYAEYCREIIIKDNASAGEWEYDMLANEWDSVELDDWMVPVWKNSDDIDYSQKNKEIDLNNMDSSMTLSLKYEEEIYHEIKNKLLKIHEDPSQALIKLLENV